MKEVFLAAAIIFVCRWFKFAIARGKAIGKFLFH
jgi:hypothetical protein